MASANALARLSLSITANISELISAERGSKFADPTIEKRRSMTIDFECRPIALAFIGAVSTTVSLMAAS
jgi:hypothetical protein